jgi:hypothetical protein
MENPTILSFMICALIRETLSGMLWKMCGLENVWVIQFKVPLLPPVIREQKYELADKLHRVSLNNADDEPVWRWTQSKIFSVKSVYVNLTRGENGPDFRDACVGMYLVQPPCNPTNNVYKKI